MSCAASRLRSSSRPGGASSWWARRTARRRCRAARRCGSTRGRCGQRGSSAPTRTACPFDGGFGSGMVGSGGGVVGWGVVLVGCGVVWCGVVWIGVGVGVVWCWCWCVLVLVLVCVWSVCTHGRIITSAQTEVSGQRRAQNRDDRSWRRWTRLARRMCVLGGRSGVRMCARFIPAAAAAGASGRPRAARRAAPGSRWLNGRARAAS